MIVALGLLQPSNPKVIIVFAIGAMNELVAPLALLEASP
jgi:hypothetical protein